MTDSQVSKLDTTKLAEQEQGTPLNQRKSVYQTTTDEGEPLDDAVSAAVAAVSREQEVLPPLSESIDIDRLETQVNSLRGAKSGAVRFFYANYRVEIKWSGELTLWQQSNH